MVVYDFWALDDYWLRRHSGNQYDMSSLFHQTLLLTLLMSQFAFLSGAPYDYYNGYQYLQGGSAPTQHGLQPFQQSGFLNTPHSSGGVGFRIPGGMVCLICPEFIGGKKKK
uniref:Uncharacterized protein n=1 Tax=Plectus sambesii TaxID=2011161 RepID=A0A914XG68_9BILA